MPTDENEARSTDYRALFYAQYHLALDLGTRTPSSVELARASRQFGGRWDKWLPSDRSAVCIDLGCGTGEFLNYLRERGFNDIRGVDLNASELEVCRSLNLSQVEQTDALRYLETIADESVGLVSAFNFFEHLTKLEILELLPRIRRVLKPGGVLLAVTPNGLSPFVGTTRYWDFSHELAFTPASWRQLARLNAFSEMHFEEYGPLPHSAFGVARCALWRSISAALNAVSYVEVGGPRDQAAVYTADMKIILRR